jgi:hypothetical protein
VDTFDIWRRVEFSHSCEARAIRNLRCISSDFPGFPHRSKPAIHFFDPTTVDTLASPDRNDVFTKSGQRALTIVKLAGLTSNCKSVLLAEVIRYAG